MRISLSTSSVVQAPPADLIGTTSDLRTRSGDLPEVALSAATRPEQSPGAQNEAPKTEKTEKIEDVVKAMNEAVRIFNRALKFEVHKDKRVVISVVDTTTGEVVRQIPPETLLDAFHRMDEALGGILINRRV